MNKLAFKFNPSEIYINDPNSIVLEYNGGGEDNLINYVERIFNRIMSNDEYISMNLLYGALNPFYQIIYEYPIFAHDNISYLDIYKNPNNNISFSVSIYREIINKTDNITYQVVKVGPKSRNPLKYKLSKIDGEYMDTDNPEELLGDNKYNIITSDLDYIALNIQKYLNDSNGSLFVFLSCKLSADILSHLMKTFDNVNIVKIFNKCQSCMFVICQDLLTNGSKNIDNVKIDDIVLYLNSCNNIVNKTSKQETEEYFVNFNSQYKRLNLRLNYIGEFIDQYSTEDIYYELPKISHNDEQYRIADVEQMIYEIKYLLSLVLNKFNSVDTDTKHIDSDTKKKISLLDLSIDDVNNIRIICMTANNVKIYKHSTNKAIYIFYISHDKFDFKQTMNLNKEFIDKLFVMFKNMIKNKKNK